MLAKLAAATLLAAASVVLMSPAAHAAPAPVKVEAGGCTGNYTEVARVLNQAVCVYNYDPDVQVILNGAPCPTGTTELASLFSTIRICYGL